jgi:ribonuclease HI
MPFYAVAKGRVPGIYRTWETAKKNVDNVKGARYKKFDKEIDAKNFMSQNEFQGKSTTSKITQFFTRADPQETEHTLIAFTDGSAINNGYANCKSGYAVCWPYHREMDFKESIKNGTNNRAEFLAFVKAIQQANTIDPRCEKTLNVYTDSMLLVNTVTDWIHKWKRNQWRKSDGNAVLNLDIIKMIDELLQHRKVSLHHVRAHTAANTWEAKYNDIVDKMANEAASQQI